MSDLMLPAKGKSAASLLQDLNADHAPDHEKPEGTNVTTLQRTKDKSNEGTFVTTNEGTKGRRNGRTVAAGTKPDGTEAAAKRPATRPGKADSIPPAAPGNRDDVPAGSGRDERIARALEQASEDEIAVVTVRVSGRLNEYMDRYVERINRVHPKRRYRKQDAIAEAFAAFYADHPMPPAPSEDDL